MDLAKTAQIANIVAVLPGSYCAYGTWVLLHPRQAGAPVNSTLLWVGFGAFAACVVIGAITGWVSRKQKQRPVGSSEVTTKLKVHSALYGTGSLDDVDVIERLLQYGTDGLVISVDNITLGCDPAPGRSKRLEVGYSYANSVVRKISRPEYSRLILPEDTQFIERTAAEYDRKRHDDLRSQAAEYGEKLEAEYERGRKEERAAIEEAQLQPRLVVCTKPEPEISNLEFQWRQTIRGYYSNLRWSQKIALKKVCECPGTKVKDLVNYLHGELDFGESSYDSIVGPLLRSGLVFINLKGDIAIVNGRVDYIHNLITEKALC